MENVSVGKCLVEGKAHGPLLHATLGLSFWGGVDPLTGIVIDRHHPLCGRSLAGNVLAIPSGRGSCSGSGVLLELITNGHAPAAIIVCEPEEILTLGALVAQMMFERTMPVLQVTPGDFAALDRHRYAQLHGTALHLLSEPPSEADTIFDDAIVAPKTIGNAGPRLDPIDEAFLSGAHGKAAQGAMRLLVRMAALMGADGFIDVTQAHIDGCIYTGPASLRFAELLVEWGARVRVPTTLNAISVDMQRWRRQGVRKDLGVPAAALAEAYVAMGARPSFTCAPYLLDSAPRMGEQVGWAESNAVVYANSVLGARTMKYPDYLDACIALTGRAPLAGCHLDAGRLATLTLEVERPEGGDDAFWPLLGYCCGSLAGGEIPLVTGLKGSPCTTDDLKAFGAAFATTAAAPMFHIDGLTPEAGMQAPSRHLRITLQDLRAAWRALDGVSSDTEATRIDLVSLGNPHFSLDECARLAGLVKGLKRSSETLLVVTCGRAVHEAAALAGYVQILEAFGAQFVTDTCWCMIGEPLIPAAARTIMTNSGKYAHYAPGLTDRTVRFGSLAACVDAATTGIASTGLPDWLL